LNAPSDLPGDASLPGGKHLPKRDWRADLTAACLGLVAAVVVLGSIIIIAFALGFDDEPAVTKAGGTTVGTPSAGATATATATDGPEASVKAAGPSADQDGSPAPSSPGKAGTPEDLITLTPAPDSPAPTITDGPGFMPSETTPAPSATPGGQTTTTAPPADTPTSPETSQNPNIQPDPVRLCSILISTDDTDDLDWAKLFHQAALVAEGDLKADLETVAKVLDSYVAAGGEKDDLYGPADESLQEIILRILTAKMDCLSQQAAQEG
jgi:hypothetical protein